MHFDQDNSSWFGDFDLINLETLTFECNFTNAALFSLGTYIWSWLKTWLFECNFLKTALISLGTLNWSSLKTLKTDFSSALLPGQLFLVWGLWFDHDSKPYLSSAILPISLFSVWGLWFDHLWNQLFEFTFTKAALFSLGTDLINLENLTFRIPCSQKSTF